MPTYATTSIINAAPMVANAAFPSANNAANLAGFDTTLATSTRPLTSVAIQASWPVLTNHANTAQTILVTLQDSADNANWANLNPLSQVQIPGVANTGAPADQYRLAFPAHLRRYARVSVWVPASGPDVVNHTLTAALVIA